MFGSEQFIEFGKKLVANYYNQRRDVTDSVELSADKVYVVWYSKSLQNHKGLFSTPISDGMYYEITYNGDKNEAYLDAYKKWSNHTISNPEEY